MTIVVAGDANADASAVLRRFPSEGDDSPIDALTWGSGGSAANVATALALLGEQTRLLARVGNDPAAEVALRAAHDAGADLSLVQHDPAVATGICFAAISPGGERTFFSFRGANASWAWSRNQVAALDGAGWLHICGHALLEDPQRESVYALIGAAHQRQIPLSLDLCLPLLRERRAEVQALLPDLQILFANELELAALCPDLPLRHAALQLAEHTPLVALKRGPHGCLIANAGIAYEAPAFAVAAIDTNGCGDAFVAGFLYAHRRAAPLEERVRLANALGALTATGRGSAEAFPQRTQLLAFLA